MSTRMIGIAIDRLLADDRLRIQFVRSRIDALADLAFTGVELTADEMALFIQSDWRVWFWEMSAAGERVH